MADGLILSAGRSDDAESAREWPDCVAVYVSLGVNRLKKGSCQMKKFLIGCLGVLLVLVLAGGTAGYFFVVKPGWEFAGCVQECVQEYAELNERIEHTDDYQAPSDGVVTNAQFQRFLVAQRDMRASMEGDLERLKKRFDAMEKELESENREAGIGDMFG